MQINFTIDPDQLPRAWAVYRLRDASGTVQYVGHCRMSQLAALPDARANPFFRAVFPPGRPLTVEVLSIEPHRIAAQNGLWRYIQQHGRPFMIAHGVRPSLKGSPVVCDQTGEKFATIKAACDAHGVSQSALSNHLANRPGYATVKNKTYSRGQSAVPLHANSAAPPPAVRSDDGGAV